MAGKVFNFRLALYSPADLRTSQEEPGSPVYDNMPLKDLPLRTLSRCLRISSCSSMIVVSEIWEHRVTVCYQCKMGRKTTKIELFWFPLINLSPNHLYGFNYDYYF